MNSKGAKVTNNCNGFELTIISIAEDFYGAYKRCLEGKNPRVDEWHRIVSDVVSVPAIVNGAFSIELFLKSLSPLSSKELKKKKHELKQLFLTLDEEDQTVIREAVEKELMGQYSFDDGLKTINNSFTFWRYIHLKPNLGYGLNVTLKVLNIFLKVIREYALHGREKRQPPTERMIHFGRKRVTK